MKKLLLHGFLLMMVLSSSCSKTPDFRNSYWGETPTDVKATEMSILDLETPASLNYRDAIGEYGVYVRYFFNDNKLYGGTVNYCLKSTNTNGVSKDLETIKQMYISKYGNPDEESFLDVKKYPSYSEFLSQFSSTENGYAGSFAKWNFKRKGYSIGIHLRTDAYTGETFVDVLYIYSKDLKSKLTRSLNNSDNDI